MSNKQPLWIMIAGPYGSGAKTDADKKANLQKLNEAALAVFRKGHIPVVGVNNALPFIEIAGTELFDSIMMPLSFALAERCDACLRIEGASTGADQEVKRFTAANKPVYYSVATIP